MRGLRRYLLFVLFLKKVNMDGVERSKLEGLDWHPIEAEKICWLMRMLLIVARKSGFDGFSTYSLATCCWDILKAPLMDFKGTFTEML